MRSYGLRQLVDNEFVSSCQHTCCMWLSKLVIHSFAASWFNKLQQVCKMTDCNKPDFNTLSADRWNWRQVCCNCKIWYRLFDQVCQQTCSNLRDFDCVSDYSFYLSQERTCKIASSVFTKSQCPKSYFNKMRALRDEWQRALTPTKLCANLVFLNMTCEIFWI